MTCPRAEVERLRAWKAEALTVLAEWEQVWEALGRPGQLGESKAAASLDSIRAITPTPTRTPDAPRQP